MKEYEVMESVDCTLSEIKGLNKAEDKIRNICRVLLNVEDYINAGAEIPKGALITGAPGSGKSLLAKCMAGQIKAAFIRVSGWNLCSQDSIERLFREVSSYKKVILLIEEIEAIGTPQEENDYYRSLMTLLNEMDGLANNGNVFVIAETAKSVEDLDSSLKKPGRFDSTIEVELPDENGRKEVIEHYLRKLPLFKKTENKEIVSDIARYISGKTPDFAPADFKNLINKTVIFDKQIEDASGDGPRHIHWEILDSKLSKFKQADEKEDDWIFKMLGQQTLFGRLYDASTEVKHFFANMDEQRIRMIYGESKKLDENDFDISKNAGRSSTAVHEVGHAYFRDKYVKGKYDITTIPRAHYGGAVFQYDGGNVCDSMEDYYNSIKMILGGRAAEMAVYGIDNTSGGGVYDLAEAKKLAVEAVAEKGLYTKFGIMPIKNHKTKEYECSEEYKRKLDDAVSNIIDKCMEEAYDELKKNRDLLLGLAEGLYIAVEMDSTEFKELYTNVEEHLANKEKARKQVDWDLYEDDGDEEEI